MSVYASSSDSENEREIHPNTRRLFGRKRSIHSILGGGKVADVLLWRDWRESGGVMVGVSVIWLLLEVMDFNFIALISHLTITAMLLLFIRCTASDFFDWNRPTIPEVLLNESSFKQLASSFHVRFNKILSKLLDIACGRDPPLFFFTTISLYIISVIGAYFSFLNLFFLGFLSMQTLPVLYELYEDDVERLAGKLARKVKRFYRKVDSNVLSKIPRGPIKQKKRI